MEIIPAILASNFGQFKTQSTNAEKIFTTIQIDVMDGKFVNSKSFNEIDKINSLKLSLTFDLHLMVEDPIKELEKWGNVRNIETVNFHLESIFNSKIVINYLRKRKYKIGIALNPNTPLSKVKDFYSSVDQVLFMTVYPGKQGAKFLPEMENKIREFTALLNSPLCAVDGGVNQETIRTIKSWGVEKTYVGSALILQPNIKIAYQNLISIIK